MEDEQETSYLRQRRKKSSMSLSCCFHGHSSHLDLSSSSSPMVSPSSTWFRSKVHHEVPELKGKSRNFMSRIGGGHARRHSGDFSYDPLSYALNFDEGPSSDDTHFDDFAARLPVSPQRRMPSSLLRIKDLELSSPRKSAQQPKIKSLDIPSSVATGRKSGDSPAAEDAGRRSTVERPAVVSHEISVKYLQ